MTSASCSCRSAVNRPSPDSSQPRWLSQDPASGDTANWRPGDKPAQFTPQGAWGVPRGTEGFQSGRPLSQKTRFIIEHL